MSATEQQTNLRLGPENVAFASIVDIFIEKPLLTTDKDSGLRNPSCEVVCARTDLAAFVTESFYFMLGFNFFERLIDTARYKCGFPLKIVDPHEARGSLAWRPCCCFRCVAGTATADILKRQQ